MKAILDSLESIGCSEVSTGLRGMAWHVSACPLGDISIDSEVSIYILGDSEGEDRPVNPGAKLQRVRLLEPQEQELTGLE